MKFLLLSLLVSLAAASNHPKCGIKPPPNLRILGGVDAAPNEFPWQGSLKYYDNNINSWAHTCGCTILNENFVLTAAHCVDREVIDPTRYKFVGGEHDFSVVSGFEVEVMIKAIYVSPVWNKAKFDGDVALLHLARPLDFDGDEKHLVPACIPDYDDIEKMDNQLAIATGWGYLTDDGQESNILKKVVVPVVSHELCRKKYIVLDPPNMVTSKQLCFGTEGKGTCLGDSGGPLNYFNFEEGRYYNFGATSYGVVCGSAFYPGVTSYIPYFTEWIWQTIDQHQ